MEFRVVSIEQLPRLAWLLDLRRDTAILYKGPWVEVGDGWFFEGAWAGDFTQRGLIDAPFWCGSGGIVDPEGLTMIPPSHSLEAIYCFSDANEARHLVSNSIACIHGADQRSRVSFEDFPAMANRAASIKLGTRDYERILYRMDTGTMYRLAFAPFRLQANMAPSEIPRPLLPPPFADFRSYMTRLHSMAALTTVNANNSKRTRRYSGIVSTISAGYDSPCVAVIAKSLGGCEAVTLSTGRGGQDDSGRRIADQLGMRCHEYPRFATGIEQRNEKDFFVDPKLTDGTQIAELDAFLGSLGSTQDTVFAPFLAHLNGALFFTGFHGGILWGKDVSPEPVIERADNSGSGFDEVRKRIGFVHIPLAFAGAEHSRLIGEISRSPAMAPYSVGGKYDKPIPRRAVEVAGVSRDSFGTRKSAGSVLFRFSREQRYLFQMALADRYEAAIRDAIQIPGVRTATG